MPRPEHCDHPTWARRENEIEMWCEKCGLRRWLIDGAFPHPTRPSTPPDPETRSHEQLGRIANALEAIARGMGTRGVRFDVPGEDDDG